MGEVERVPARKVVVAALPLSKRQLETLAGQLGPSFQLVDIRQAPDRADFVLCPPCSPQTTRKLCDAFPGAHVVALELQDEESGLRIDGPVARSLSGGASAYFVAASGHAVGDFLLASAAATERRAVEPPASARELAAPTIDDVLIAHLEALATHRSRPRGSAAERPGR